MNFKKIFLTLLVTLIMFSAIPVNNNFNIVRNSGHVYAEGTVTIYAPDGRSALVYESQVEEYLKLGWYRSFEEVTTTIYAPDGRSILIYIQDLPAYLSLGWYDSFDKITSTIYAPDGRQITVYNIDIPSYLALGWYRTYEEVTTTIYAPDGRQITVYNDDAYTYLNWGWYKTIEEVTRTVISPDGQRKTVYLSELSKYQNDGWHVAGYADPSKPMVALSFDDGPSPYYTKRIVDTLVKYGASASFFVVGEFVEKYPEICKYTYDMGMEIGNHTYTHADLTKCSAQTLSGQINNTSAEIKLATGSTPVLLRPPYGSLNLNVKSLTGMPIILWSIDTRDWESRNVSSIYNTVAGKVKDGDIILMHDLYQSTADAVDKIVPYLINNGFQIVSVSTLANCKGYKLQNGTSYRHFR